jgi:hypothetical protein
MSEKSFVCREKECKDRKIQFRDFTSWHIHMLGAHKRDFKTYKDYKPK